MFKRSKVRLYDDTYDKPAFVIEHIPLYDGREACGFISASTDAETRSESGTSYRFDIVDISPSKNELASQVQQELRGLRTQVSELQTQVNLLTSKAINSAADHANEVATLRAENADLRRLLSNTPSNIEADRRTAGTFISPASHKRTSSEAGFWRHISQQSCMLFRRVQVVGPIWTSCRHNAMLPYSKPVDRRTHCREGVGVLDFACRRH